MGQATVFLRRRARARGAAFVQSRHSTHVSWLVALYRRSTLAAISGLAHSASSSMACAAAWFGASSLSANSLDHVAFGEVEHVLHALCVLFLR